MLFALCFSAHAQQLNTIRRIAFLSTSDTGADSARYEGIRQRLRELGYVEGRNISIEYRSAGGSLDRYREIANEVVRLKVDIIVVGGGTIYVEAVKKATKMIPIVMTGPGGDPVQAGLIASLARPGGNVTGLTNLTRELGGKRLELLNEALPKLERVAVIYDPTNPAHATEMKESLRPSAHALKLMPSHGR
jgi:putative ABC transport system substrate-binding protein